MPRYLPTIVSVAETREMFQGFYTGDGTRNGNGFASSSGSGLSSTTSSGSSDSNKSKK